MQFNFVSTQLTLTRQSPRPGLDHTLVGKPGLTAPSPVLVFDSSFLCLFSPLFISFVSVSLLPFTFFFLESQAPTLAKPMVPTAGRLLLPRARGSPGAEAHSLGHRLRPAGGLCGEGVQSSAPAWLLSAHPLHGAGSPS